MIWVIGDIHGMFDPLRNICEAIHDFEEQGEPPRKVIFLGDYIDHGPCAKEVIDYILALEYEKILIMGNHEDLALRFINQDLKTLKKFGNAWLYNGGIKTYRSIYREVKPELLPENLRSGRKFLSLSGEGDYRDEYYLDYHGFELPGKYEKFLKDLQYVHREGFEVNGRLINFTFCHGLPRWDQTLEEQRVKTYDEFNSYLRRKVSLIGTEMSDCFNKDLWYYDKDEIVVEQSFVWGRNYSFQYGYQGDVIIHGHTPVQLYDYYFNSFYGLPRSRYTQFLKFFQSPKDLPFLFTRSPWAGYNFEVKRQTEAYLVDRPEGPDNLSLNLEAECIHFDSGPSAGVEAINIDTGAVYGNCLTAIGLSPKYLAFGLIPVLSSRLNCPFTTNPTLRFLHVNGFGGKKSMPNFLKIKKRPF